MSISSSVKPMDIDSSSLHRSSSVQPMEVSDSGKHQHHKASKNKSRSSHQKPKPATPPHAHHAPPPKAAHHAPPPKAAPRAHAPPPPPKSPLHADLVQGVLSYYNNIYNNPKTEYSRKKLLLHVHPDKVSAHFKKDSDYIKKNAKIMEFINSVFVKINGKPEITKKGFHDIIADNLKLLQ